MPSSSSPPSSSKSPAPSLDAIQAPFVCPPKVVKKEWIDYNNHLNMSYYSLLFDQSLDAVFSMIGCDEAYMRTQHGSSFTLEAHISYLRELRLGDGLRITFQLLDYDTKRLHYFLSMYHEKQNYLAATSEQLCLHVDMTQRRGAPFPPQMLAKIAQLKKAHQHLRVPPQVGHVMGCNKKPASL